MAQMWQQKQMGNPRNPVNWPNRTVLRAENYAAMCRLNSNSFDAVISDPLFKKQGKYRGVSPQGHIMTVADVWRWDEVANPIILGNIRKECPESAALIELTKRTDKSMAAFLCSTHSRTVQAFRVLKPNGIFVMQCDCEALHYLKALLDCIVGVKNFVMQITWERSNPKGNATRTLSNNADHFLVYQKPGPDKYTFNPEAVTMPYDRDNLPEKTLKQYNRVNHEGRRYRMVEITAPKQDPKSPLTYEVFGVTRTWRWTEERMCEAIKSGRVPRPNAGTVPRQIAFLDEQPGVKLSNIWAGDVRGGKIGKMEGSAADNTGRPFQKPVPLYERLVRMFTNPGDWVLDHYGGCGTTARAAEKCGRKWVVIDIDVTGELNGIIHHLFLIDGFYGHPPNTMRFKHLEAEYPLTSTDFAALQNDWHADKALVFCADLEDSRLSHRTDEGSLLPNWKHRRQSAQMSMLAPSKKELKAYVIQQHGLVCLGCDTPFTHERHLELDRIEPANGYVFGNVQPLCGSCNSSKGGNHTLQWLRKRNAERGLMYEQVVAKR